MGLSGLNFGRLFLAMAVMFATVPQSYAGNGAEPLSFATPDTKIVELQYPDHTVEGQSINTSVQVMEVEGLEDPLLNYLHTEAGQPGVTVVTPLLEGNSGDQEILSAAGKITQGTQASIATEKEPSCPINLSGRLEACLGVNQDCKSC